MSSTHHRDETNKQTSPPTPPPPHHLHLPTPKTKPGLAAFALQCTFFAFARHIQDVLFALLFSTLANLVYPSVSSLVSRCAFFFLFSPTHTYIMTPPIGLLGLVRRLFFFFLKLHTWNNALVFSYTLAPPPHQ